MIRCMYCGRPAHPCDLDDGNWQKLTVYDHENKVVNYICPVCWGMPMPHKKPTVKRDSISTVSIRSQHRKRGSKPDDGQVDLFSESQKALAIDKAYLSRSNKNDDQCRGLEEAPRAA